MQKQVLTLIYSLLLGLTLTAQDAQRPNILWLTCEDNNVDWIGCYGNPHADTPHIDQLAAEGFRYTHAYANAPVCAPSRSTWITGIHAISMGTHPMRSRYEIPHDLIKYYPDHLKANGYYVGNYKKTDYNIGGREDSDCWDNAKQVGWQTLKNNQPFFQIINSTKSHESKAFGDVQNTKHDPANTILRKYHPDVPAMRMNYAKYHDAIKAMDQEIGDALQKLEDMGLADDTIVIYNSDHGGVLPRSKRFLFSSGIHCPLIIRIPEKYKALWPAEHTGTTVDRIVSFVDMPATWLNITNTKIPEIMQGQPFLGTESQTERALHYAFRARMDERVENARAVGDKQFLYIRNYMPYTPWMQPLNFLWRMQATQAWVEHVESGKASEVEVRFFKPKNWTEEFYDTVKDPDNINNLIDNPEYAGIINRMRTNLRDWQENVFDTGMLPESEMVRLAAKNKTTIYEVARNPKLYNLPSLLDAADLALEEDPTNRPALRALLSSPDLGLRYWGMVGCFLLDDTESAQLCLEDDSHEVRAMAGWLLLRSGDTDAGLQCLKSLLEENSYATLTVLNIIDWAGDAAKPLLPTVKAIKVQNYEERMQIQLLAKYGLGSAK
ncbi:MAG: sulfatase-like hydrolase/transferase [Opitutaceae bacterium]